MKYITLILYSLLFLVSTSVFSATFTWDGGGADNNWMTAANWVGDVAPSAGDDIIFSGSTRPTVNNDFTAGTSFKSITLSGSATTNFIMTGNALLLSGGATAIANNNATYGITISNDITFSTAAPTISGGPLTISSNINNGGFLLTINISNQATFSGVISGSGGLTKMGSATLILSGSNTFSGGFTINAGTIKIGNSSALGSTSGTITIAAGVNLDTSGGSKGLGAYPIVINGDFTFVGTNSLNMGTGAVTLGATVAINCSGSTFTLGGIISGSFGITKSGNGTAVFSGANTYTGTTTISGGTLRLGSTSALGTTAGSTVVNTGASLDLNGQTYASSEDLTLNGTGLSSGGALKNSSGTAATFPGLITLGSASSIIATSGNITLSNTGTITGATFGLTIGGAGNGTIASIIGITSGTITKQDAGTWTLSGANTYTGSTTVSAGILKLGSTTALGTTAGATTVSSGAALDLNGQTYASSEDLTLNGTGVSSGGALMNSSATAATFPGLITLGSTSSIIATSGDITISNIGTITGATYGLTLGGAFNGTIASIIGTTSGTLTKQDAGTWTLSGANTYTGTTTISTGTLKLGAAGVIPDASALTVTGTLDMNTYSETVGSIAGAGTIDNVSGGGTPTLICGGDGTSTTFSGVITDATGTLSLTKNGAGTLTLSGANTYAGTTTLNQGTISLSGGNNRLPTGTTVAFNVALANNPTTVLALGTTSQTISQLTFPDLASTTAVVTGSGSSTLTINGSYNLEVSQGGAITSTYSYTLDLSGLPNFVFNSSTKDIRIGLDDSGTTNTVDPGTYTVTLATNNTITANNIYVGKGVANSNGGTAALNMGATNTLNVDNIYVGYNMRNNATMQFSAGGSTATIRNIDGTSAVTEWNVGRVSTYNATTWTSTVDLSNGTIDAEVTTMIIGAATDLTSNRMGTTDATFILGAGTLTVTNLTVGTMFDGGFSVNGAFAANGTLTINHANAILNVTTLTLGTNTMNDLGGTRTISSTVNLTSGKINATSIVKGVQTGTATLTMAFNWTNGTVANLGSGNLNVTDVPMALVVGTHTFDISSSYTGTLNSNSILSGATGIVKTSAGTLTLSAANTYTGTTSVSAGILKLGSTTALGTTAAGTTVSSGASLDLNGQTYASSEAITLNGTGISSGGALMNSSSTAATFPGLITLGSTSSIIATSGDITLSNTGTITGATFGLTLGGASNGTIASIIGTTSGTLTKQDAGTWTLSDANTFTGTTTISAGTLVLQDQYASTSHVISSGAILELNRSADIDYTASSTYSGAGTLRKTGVGAVEWGVSAATFALSSGGLIDIVAGNFTGGSNANEVWTNNYADLTVASGAAFNGVEANVRVDVISGLGSIYSGYSGAGYSNFTFGVDNGSGTFTGVLSDNSAAANFVKSGTGTITLSGTNTYTGTTTVSAGILKLNNTAALGTNAAGTTVSSGAALDLNGITYSTTEALTISGTGISSGGALINTGSSASFAGTVTLAADATINTANQITLSGTISPSTYSLTKAGTNSLVFTSNTATVNNLAISAGTLSAGSSTINIYGNFTNSGTFTCGTGTVAFKGASAQSIASATFYNLTIDNSTSPATSAVTLTGNITVGGALTMTTGIFNTSSNAITLGTTATISETNPSSTDPTSYVTGTVTTTRNLIQNVTNTFGGIGVSLTESTQASNSTAVTRQTGTASVGAGNQSILRYFDISPAVDANLNGTMEFSYINAELNSQAEDSLKIYKSTNSGSTWVKQASSTVNTGSNSLSLSGITSFSRWTASNKTTNPLPVEFVRFTATKGKDATSLKWETAQEINNDYFDIERSHDGINFEKITSIKGVGTTNSISNYSYLDKSTNLTLATYYRLKQVDFDKKTEYSNIVFVNGQTNYQDITLFPNPIEEGKILYATMGNNDEGIIKVSIFDMTGKLIHDFLIDNVVANSNIIIENQNHSFKKGIYIIEIKSINNDYKQKLEVK